MPTMNEIDKETSAKDKYNCAMLEDYNSTFQELMLDILQRRALFSAFEKSIIGKDGSIADNMFVNFYASDYFRAQLTDMRKFFETDNRSYKISFILEHLTDNTIKEKYKFIYDNNWKKSNGNGDSLEHLANKAVMHKERNYFHVKVHRNQMDEVIDKMNDLLDELVNMLSKENFSVSYLLGSKDAAFLKIESEDDLNEYIEAVAK